ncbi:MAG TPA: pyridoxamine 5'-phosphate oxidase family protein [Acidimicrobiales bacterium]|nr:pyridoxamine 5'-phosphate oxidase family protein [Acidimicrobiales bacterium]
METDHNGMAVLSTHECLRRLGRNGIGRIGLSIGALPAILPVMYAVVDGEIYFQTQPGAKMAAATENAIVAFEVDDSDLLRHTGWSVLVVGRAERVDGPSAALLGPPLLRWVGHRDADVLVRIRPEMVSGRQIQIGGAGATSPQACEVLHA